MLYLLFKSWSMLRQLCCLISYCLIVFLFITNNSYGQSFGQQTTINKDFNGPQKVVSGDFDQDGDQDLVSIAFWNANVTWYKNDGKGNFQKNKISRNLSFGDDIDVGDLNGDGYPDIISTTANLIKYFENSSQQHFTPKNIDSGNNPRVARIADLDQDGKTDVIAALEGSNNIVCYQNQGGGNFNKRILAGNLSNIRDLEIVDLNRDQNLDVIYGSYSNNTIGWLKNVGPANFSKNVIDSNAKGVSSIGVKDIDGDQDRDLVAAVSDKNNFTWYENDGNQNFSTHILDPNVDNPYDVKLVDLNKDGLPDILGGVYDDDEVNVYINDQEQNFGKYNIAKNLNGVNSVSAANLDGDNVKDVFASSYNDFKISWYRNTTKISSFICGNSKIPQSGFEFAYNDSVKTMLGDSTKVQDIFSQSISAFGHANADFNGNGVNDLVLLLNKNTIKLWDDADSVHTTIDITAEPARDQKTVLSVGRWNGQGPSIFYANSAEDAIYRVAPGNSPRRVALLSNGSNAVAGIADIDGDNSNELVFADASQEVRFIDGNNGVKTTGVTIGSNNGIGLGNPADFNKNGKASVPVVYGGNEIKLLGANGIRATVLANSSKEAKKAPIAAANVDCDKSLELVFQKGDSPDKDKLRYIDDVRGANTTNFIHNIKQSKVKANDDIGVVSLGYTLNSQYKDDLTTYDTINRSTCGSYTVPSGDKTVNQTGTYYDTLPRVNRGDSVLVIKLTINLNDKDTLNVSAKNSYTVPSGDETYTSSGHYYDTLRNQIGCDSLLFINLTVDQIGSPFADSLTALKFDGKDDYVEVDSLPSDIVNSSFSVSLWFNGNGKGNDSLGSIFCINTKKGGNRLLLYDSLFYDCQSNKNISYNRPVYPNKWNHLGVTYNKRENILKVFINGQLDTFLSKRMRIAQSDKISFGQDWDKGKSTSHFAGKMDDIRIYDTVLTRSKLTGNICQNLERKESHLVSYWNFNTGRGPVAKDRLRYQVRGILKPKGKGPKWVKAKKNHCKSPVGNTLSFDGKDDFVRFSEMPSGIVGSDFTISTWFKDLGPNQNNSSEALFAINTANNGERLIIYKDRIFDKQTGYNVPFGNNLHPNQWQNLVITYNNQQNNLKVYLNGRLDTTYSTSIAISQSDRISIGQNSDSSQANAYFKGLIQQVKIWKEVRTQSQIKKDKCASSTNGKNLVAAWLLNTKQKDSVYSVNGALNGQLMPNKSNGPQWTFTVNDYCGTLNKVYNPNALLFDGKDDYLNVDSFPFNKINNQDFTVSTWFKDKKGTNPKEGEALFAINTPNGLNKLLVYTDFIYVNGINTNVKLNNNLDTNEWQNLTVSYKNSLDSLVIYKNGDVDTTLYANLQFANKDQLSIGQEWDRNQNTAHFSGLIDEVKVWQSFKPIQAIHKINCDTLSNQNLLAYWNFNEGPNSYAIDSNNLLKAHLKPNQGFGPKWVRDTFNRRDCSSPNNGGNGPNATCNRYVSQVLNYSQGLNVDQTPISAKRSNVNNVLGPPSSQSFFSTGYYNKSFVTVAFDRMMTGKLSIYETTWNSTNYLEESMVYVSIDRQNWIFVGKANNQANQQGDIHSSVFDLDTLTYRYVKVVDVSDSSQFPADGDAFDLTAVCAEKANAPQKTINSGCFTVKKLFANNNGNGTLTTRYRVINGCNKGWSNSAFELKPGTQALQYVSGGNYPVENTTNNPYHSIKYECNKPDCFKNGDSSFFQFTINASDTVRPVRVTSKAGMNQRTVSFNEEGPGDSDLDSGSSTGLSTINWKNRVSVYPNPVDQRTDFTVQWKRAINVSKRLQLVNPHGKIVRNMMAPAGSQRISIQTGGLNSGLYMLRQGNRVLQKVVIQQ